MTEAEMRDWLGIEPDRELRAWVVDALRDVPVPRTAQDHMVAFRSFLKGAADAGIEPGRGPKPWT